MAEVTRLELTEAAELETEPEAVLELGPVAELVPEGFAEVLVTV